MYNGNTKYREKGNKKMKFRNDVVNITNELARNQGVEVDVIEVATQIQNYCITNKIPPRKNSYEIKDGILFINGNGVERVVSIERVTFSDEGYYWEGRILSQAGL